jgi:hypothetical protein
VVARARRSSPELPDTSTGGGTSLPKLVTDPVWSLRPWPVEVEVAGESYTIPAMPAADWLALLMEPRLRPDHIFPGLLDGPGQAEIEEAVHDGLMDVEEYLNLGLEVLSQVTGRPWWVSLRLISVARNGWDAVGGELVRKADADRLSIAGWIDVAYHVIIQAMEDNKRPMFLLKLELPPDGWGEETDSLEMSQDDFLAMAGQ